MSTVEVVEIRQPMGGTSSSSLGKVGLWDHSGKEEEEGQRVARKKLKRVCTTSPKEYLVTRGGWLDALRNKKEDK